jgi:putative Mn2+ efflux pump MntP
MNKSGLIRRIVILIAFAIGFDHFVLSDSQYIAEASSREFLKLFLWGATAFGIVTVLSQHFGKTSQRDKEDQ